MRLRVALAFAVTSLILLLSLFLGLFRWQMRSSDKFSRVDLALMPVGLAAGLAFGKVTGRWRFQALTGLAPQLARRTFWKEKEVLFRSESGRKALDWDHNCYSVLFYLFIVVMIVSGGYFMPVATTSFFVFGVWLTGQNVPYARLWLRQRRSRTEAGSDVAGEATSLFADSLKERGSGLLGDQEGIRTRKRFDPRPRIAVVFFTLIFFPIITFWGLWTPGKAGVFWLAMVLLALAAGLAIGAVPGRWRLLGLQEVSSQLGGRILFREPYALSDSRFGQRAIRTDKVLVGLGSALWIAWEILSHSLFLPTDTLMSFFAGVLLTGHVIPYVRFLMNEGEDRRAAHP